VQASEIGHATAAGWRQLALTGAEIIALGLCSLFKRDRHVFMASRVLACISAIAFLFGIGISPSDFHSVVPNVNG
jgi:hypothetical protein